MEPALPPPIEQVQRGPIRLYDLGSLAIATFIASPLAGGFLASRNLQALGRSDEATAALVLGAAGLALAVLAAFYVTIPPHSEQFSAFLLQLAQIAAVHFAAKRSHGEALAAHINANGALFSRWRAAGVAILFVPVVVAAIFGAATLLPEAPGLGQ